MGQPAIPPTTLTMIKQIYKTENMVGLYKGFVPSVIGKKKKKKKKKEKEDKEEEEERRRKKKKQKKKKKKNITK